MLERALRSLGVISDTLQTAALLLIAVVFTGAGAVLASAGRPEAVILLLLATATIVQLPKRLGDLYRDVTGNY